MNDIKKPRGRPKKAETLECERMEAVFKNKPPNSKDRDDGFTSNFDYKRAKQIAADLLAEFPPTVPHDLIYAASSHYEDAAVELRVQNLIAKTLAATSAGRLSGGEALKQKALEKACALWSKNTDLIIKMNTRGFADMTAKKIIKNWDLRGIPGDVPSVNTIVYWFKLYKDSRGL